MEEPVFNKEKLKILNKKIQPKFPVTYLANQVIDKVKQYQLQKKPWYLRPMFSPLQLASAFFLFLVLLFPLFYLWLEINQNQNPNYLGKGVTQKVVLSYYSTEPVKVEVLGDFNQWQRGVHILKPVGENKYQIELHLPPGRYQYIFLVNDQLFQMDPFCQEQVEDGYGNLNSLLVI